VYKREIYLAASEVSSDKNGSASAPDTGATVTGLHGNSETILIVDDETIQRDIASELLTSLNYHTVTAASGEEGIELLKKEHIDLVLLDMLMEPGINGRETYARMCEIQPGLKAVIASGFSENNEVEKALASGPSTFIKKPYTIQCLGEIVKKILTKDST
jgi:CheY-like chemotaxis protein